GQGGRESPPRGGRGSVVVKWLIEFLSAALTLRRGGTPGRAEADDRRALEAVAGRADPDALLEVLERCLEGDLQNDQRVQLVLVVEALLDAVGPKLAAKSG